VKLIILQRRFERMGGLTDITVDRGHVDHVFVPHNGVDALQQASKTGPGHEQASSRIPSCAVRPILEECSNQENASTYIQGASRREWHREQNQ
jgi:hypothetical protein